jgi:RNA polymerase sigma-70 factor (ECF subfamily)
MVVPVWCAGRADDAHAAPSRSSSPNAKPYLALVPDAASAADAALVVQLQRNDEAALEALIDLYGERLHRLAFAILRSEDEAADAVQDTFVALWNARARLDPAHGVAGYLFRAARNHAFKIRDREATQQRLRADSRNITIPGITMNTGDYWIAQRELAAAVSGALRTLQPRVREIFLMHRAHDMSYADIAATLGVGVATVHSQMSRAVKRIAEQLARLDR